MEMRNMKVDLNEVLRELSEMYDEDSSDTYVTLYLKKDALDQKFLERREKACRSLLKGDEKKNFTDTMEAIREFLKKNVSVNIAIFASHKYNVLKAVSLPVEIDNSLIVDSSPYIRPLARIQDEWESFTLVLLSSNYAKIYSLSLGEIEYEKNLSKDIMNRHKKGGCSQARFQRLRKGAIHAFLTEVVEALEKIADKRIVLAGPGTSKIQFRDMLPKYLAERIVDVIDISIDDEKELLKESVRLISEKEEQKSSEAVQQLKEEILKDGLAAYGAEETLQAVKNGQVELLIVEKDYNIKGWICEHCQIVKEGSVKECLSCGGSVSEVDVIEEILEFAERTDADVEFTDDEEIANLGHIGAILRYK
jgi:peptide chain release factor subunit 1